MGHHPIVGLPSDCCWRFGIHARPALCIARLLWAGQAPLQIVQPPPSASTVACIDNSDPRCAWLAGEHGQLAKKPPVPTCQDCTPRALLCRYVGKEARGISCEMRKTSQLRTI